MSKKKPSSASVIWKFQVERFQFAFDVWDVNHAKQIIEGKARPILELELAPLRRYVGAPGKIMLLGVGIDWKKAQSEAVDLATPIIMAYGKDKFLPIDGWHRIAKALLQGLKTLPAVKLTKIESELIHRYVGRTRRPRRRR